MAQTKKVDENQAQWTPPKMPERFKKIETQRFMYSPERCFGFAVTGYAIGREDMKPIDMGKNPKDGSPIMRDWSCIIVRLTQDTKATNRDKNIIDVYVGQNVLVPTNFQIENFLSQHATHPTRVFEVFISPKNQIDLGGGKKLWDFDLGVNPESKTLDEVGLLMKAGAKKQLSDGRTFDTQTGEVS